MQPTRRKGPPRRGAPPPPRRKKKKIPAVLVAAPASAGFESLAARAAHPRSDRLLSGFLTAQELEHVDFERSEKAPLLVTPREVVAFAALASGAYGLLSSIVLHLLFFIVLLTNPDLFSFRGGKETHPVTESPKDRLVMMAVPPLRAPALPAPVAPAPQPEAPATPPQSSGILIPKAVEPPPPDKRQSFQNDLPFSEGNTDEFYSPKESKKPGDPGGVTKPAEPVPESAPEPERKLAGIGPDVFSFPSKPREIPRPKAPDPGDNGQGGDSYDLTRFLRDKQFHNPEGGLVTGHDNTLYFNDKGANLVPWIRRMLAEVRRNWIVPFSAAYLAGHVAVGITVARDGSIADLKLLVPSQTAGFDNAAVGALRASQLLPLPPDYPDPQFDIILVFWYNERPYDIFN